MVWAGEALGFSAEFDNIERSEARNAAARSVFTEAEDWRGTRRAVASRRWIWELLQNAKDAAHGRQFSFSIKSSKTALVVEHDAGPFELREIVALVESVRRRCNAVRHFPSFSVRRCRNEHWRVI
jgi:hypothetical protein